MQVTLITDRDAKPYPVEALPTLLDGKQGLVWVDIPVPDEPEVGDIGGAASLDQAKRLVVGRPAWPGGRRRAPAPRRPLVGRGEQALYREGLRPATPSP